MSKDLHKRKVIFTACGAAAIIAGGILGYMAVLKYQDRTKYIDNLTGNLTGIEKINALTNESLSAELSGVGTPGEQRQKRLMIAGGVGVVGVFFLVAGLSIKPECPVHVQDE